MDFDFDFDCDGHGIGWFIPALIVGRLIADAFDRPQRGWAAASRPAPASQPQAPAAAAPPAPREALECQSCHRPVNAEFNYCPHCGGRLAPRVCRYCGQPLRREMTYCPHCGGPAQVQRT